MYNLFVPSLSHIHSFQSAFIKCWLFLGMHLWKGETELLQVRKLYSLLWYLLFRSIQFSCSVMSDSLQPHRLQHARLLCPSSTPGAYSNFIESVMPSNHLILCRTLSSCLQSFSASVSFQMSEFFASDGQSIGVSASASVLPMNIQDWFPFDWFDLLAVQGTLKSFLQYHGRWRGHGGEFWQSMVHWRREWQTTSVFLPWEPHELIIIGSQTNSALRCCPFIWELYL